MRPPIFILFSAHALVAERQASETSTASADLVARIVGYDSAMFAAFNAHDADRLATFFSPDLEFYHDKDGLNGYDTTMMNFRRLFERNRNTGMRRELVPGSLEVHPLGEYGALEVCSHRFCHEEDGEQDCGTFKNIMIWQNDSGEWKVTRVISYDH